MLPAPNHQFEHPLSPLENDDPFILLLAPLLKSLSNAIDDFSKFELIFVFMELAPIYTKILHSINTVTIKRDSPNQYVCMNNNIYQKIIDANSRNKKPIVVIFPEGGTSGKYNLGGPYSLLEFKDGYRRLAKDLNLAILPIAIKVDSDINYFAHFGQFLPENGNVNDDRQTLINLLNFNNVS